MYQALAIPNTFTAQEATTDSWKTADMVRLYHGLGRAAVADSPWYKALSGAIERRDIFALRHMAMHQHYFVCDALSSIEHPALVGIDEKQSGDVWRALLEWAGNPSIHDQSQALSIAIERFTNALAIRSLSAHQIRTDIETFIACGTAEIIWIKTGWALGRFQASEVESLLLLERGESVAVQLADALLAFQDVRSRIAKTQAFSVSGMSAKWSSQQLFL